jgi:phage terminase small subunit
MMARPHKPTELLELSGAFRKNPARRRVNPKTENPLGDAPEYLRADERVAWAEIVFHLPEGVAVGSDRIALELFCQLVAKMRRRVATAAETGQLIKMFACFGFSPSDRSRISVAPKTEEADPYERF